MIGKGQHTQTKSGRGRAVLGLVESVPSRSPVRRAWLLGLVRSARQPTAGGRPRGKECRHPHARAAAANTPRRPRIARSPTKTQGVNRSRHPRRTCDGGAGPHWLRCHRQSNTTRGAAGEWNPVAWRMWCSGKQGPFASIDERLGRSSPATENQCMSGKTAEPKKLAFAKVGKKLNPYRDLRQGVRDGAGIARRQNDSVGNRRCSEGSFTLKGNGSRPALTEGTAWWTELSLQGMDQAAGAWLMQGHQASPYRSSFVGSAASV